VWPGAVRLRAKREPDRAILLSTDDTPGTWWHLTRTGIDDAGLPGGYEAVIEGWFGQPFADEKAAVAFLVAQVKASDLTTTAMCARTAPRHADELGRSLFSHYYFSVRDDDHGKD
jgi:hypothetical protein